MSVDKFIVRLGHRKDRVFDTLEEASKKANEFFTKTGIIVAVEYYKPRKKRETKGGN